MKSLGPILTVLVTTLCLYPGAAQAVPLINGGFEQPVVAPPFQLINSSFPGWTLESGSVDIVTSSFWDAAEGSQSLDLDGTAPGTISQSFATTIGQTFDLSFQFANNPGALRSALVTLSGAAANDLLSQTITHGTSVLPSPMNYTPFTFSFVANSAITTLRFASLSAPGSAQGIVLDDVAVVAAAGVPEIDPRTAMVSFGFILSSMLLLGDRRKIAA